MLVILLSALIGCASSQQLNEFTFENAYTTGLLLTSRTSDERVYIGLDNLNSDAQHWILKSASCQENGKTYNGYNIINKQTHKCLESNSQSKAYTKDCQENSVYQFWSKFTSSFTNKSRIQNVKTGLYLNSDLAPRVKNGAYGYVYTSKSEKNPKVNNAIKFNLEFDDFNRNKDQLTAGISLLKSENDINKLFTSDALSSFLCYLYSFTQVNIRSDDVVQIGEFFVQNEFYSQLHRLDEYFSLTCENIQLSGELSEIDCEKKAVLEYVQYVTNDLFFFSRSMKLKYFEIGGIKNLIRYLKNDTFVDRFCHERVFLFIMSNINVLSKEAEYYKSEWFDLDAIEALLKIAKKNETLKADVYTIVCRIAYDREINSLIELPEIAALFLKFLKKGAALLGGEDVVREKLEYVDGKFEVLMIYDDELFTGTWSITSILEVLYKLAINDKIKYDLYVKYNLKEPLSVVIYKGSEIERRYALKLLAQLCFDSLVLDTVAKDDALVEFLKKLSKESSKMIHDLCDQVLWSFDVERKTKEARAGAEKRQQVMISYNSGSRDLCIRIKNELEKAGYRIWIDVNEIHGSSLDSMADAVDSSDVILLCVTEKYRQSINCQAEAQYAFKRKKLIIPLIMQKGYESVGGWLGMIMGDRIHINFVKSSYDDAVKKLVSQLHLVKPVANSTVVVAAAAAEASTTDSMTKSVSDWSEDEVVKWFQSNGNMTIYNFIKPCDGKLLNQLHEMQSTAPEFFYQFISVKQQVEGRDVLLFAMNLKELFKK